MFGHLEQRACRRPGRRRRRPPAGRGTWRRSAVSSRRPGWSACPRARRDRAASPAPCSAASRSVHACRRSSREAAAANRARLFDNGSRSTSEPHTSPRNVAKLRVHSHVGRGECAEALLGGGCHLARPRQVQHAMAGARLDRLPQNGRLSHPGRPWTRRAGPSCRMNCDWSAVQGRPTRSASSISCCENGR